MAIEQGIDRRKVAMVRKGGTEGELVHTWYILKEEEERKACDRGKEKDREGEIQA